jgi:hypothetical protein
MNDLANPTNAQILNRIDLLEQRILAALGNGESSNRPLPEYMTAPLTEDGMYTPSYLLELNETVRKNHPSGWLSASTRFRNAPVQLIRSVFWSQVVRHRLENDSLIVGRFEAEKNRVFSLAISYYGSGVYIIPLNYPPANEPFGMFDIIVPGSYVANVQDPIVTDSQLKSAIERFYQGAGYL